ncbi:adenosylcobinamide-GDP ribazoletransferase [Sulfurimonas sp. SAG-AH-194-L11]|nr:adenosylcobinamide-GDP ribazoletransferase [Sulfurimonas sp. SAG-AH-194-L11]MDF1876279.1 adenosylcobinamide-GDP ribazoletransferase [Sulfurimonas sp. SAG-AH-194-L11]
MTHILKGFALAVSMLTILPFFRVHEFYKGINGYSVMFYPLVGFLLGALLFLISLVLTLYIPSFHLGVILFALWVLLSGGLHLDGYCDTIDGLFVDKSRALEVMKDPHNGGMGMIFGGVFFILKASSLAAFELVYLLPLILMLPRLAVVFMIYTYPYISKSGMGSLAKEELKGWQLFIALFYTLAVVWYFHAWVLLLVTALLTFVIKHFFIKRYGGFSGDMYGFGIEVIELILLNVTLVGLV